MLQKFISFFLPDSKSNFQPAPITTDDIYDALAIMSGKRQAPVLSVEEKATLLKFDRSLGPITQSKIYQEIMTGEYSNV